MANLAIEEQQISTVPVLVVVPTLNEEVHIRAVLANLLLEAEEAAITIVVADGGSTDGTTGIVKSLAKKHESLYLLENTKIVQSAAVNLAVQEFGSDAEFLIRVDAHASYPDRYCNRLLSIRQRTGADSVVVGMHARGDSCFQRATAAAQNSILGNGGSAHRNRAAGGWIDHGHHALITMDAFRAVDGYDESSSPNEDVDLDARLVERGFGIFLAEELSITYYPRRSPGDLFAQYYKFGRGRAHLFLKHRSGARVRHLILVSVAPIIVLLILSPVSAIFAIPAFLWVLLCLGFGALLGVQSRDRCAASAGIAAMVMQAAWSFGFFAGLIRTFRSTGSPVGGLKGRDRIVR